MSRGGIQRGSWWNRFWFGSATDILSLLSAASPNSSKTAEYILRYYRVRYWQRYHGFPKGEENLKHQINTFTNLIGFDYSFQHRNRYVWVVWYKNTRFFLVVSEKSLLITCNPRVPADMALSFMSVMFIRLLWHLFNRQPHRDPES